MGCVRYRNEDMCFHISASFFRARTRINLLNNNTIVVHDKNKSGIMICEVRNKKMLSFFYEWDRAKDMRIMCSFKLTIPRGWFSSIKDRGGLEAENGF